VNSRNIIILFLILVVPLRLYAEEHRLLIDFELSLSFLPEEAWIIVSDGKTLDRQPAFTVPPADVEMEGVKDERTLGTGKWLFGGRVVPPVKGNARYGLLVFGKVGQVAFAPLRGRAAGEVIDNFQDTESLHGYIQQRKERLNAAMSIEAEQEAELKRLRSDVDLIADIGRIVEVREESISTEENLKRLDKDTQDLERSLQQVSAYPTPRNFLRREAELSKQTIELGGAAKAAEERAKKNEAEQIETPAQKRELIESVKDENEQALVQKLGTLRRYRLELEAQRNIYLEH